MVIIFLFTFYTILVVDASPQYRIVVDPPIEVFNLPPGSTPTNVTMCFSDTSARSIDFNSYCPLGTSMFPPNGPNNPLKKLDLGLGAEHVSPIYQTKPIRLLVRVSDNSGANVLVLANSSENLELGGPLRFINLTQSDRYVLVKVGVRCLPEFTTSSNCNSRIVKKVVTSSPPTMTIATTNTVPSPPSNEDSCSMATAIGIVAGFAVGILITLLINNLTIWCLLKRRKKKRGQANVSAADQNEIKTERNPVYGVQEDVIETARNLSYDIQRRRRNGPENRSESTNTESIEMARNPVYNITTEAEDSSPYYY